MAEGDPPEDQETIQPSSAQSVMDQFQQLYERVETLGQTVITMQTGSTGRFPSQLNTALPQIGSGLTDIGLRLHGVSASAAQQVMLEAAYIPAHAEAVQTLKAAKQACASARSAIRSGGQCTPEQSQTLATATAAEDAARSHLHQVWDGAATQATSYAQPIPAHGTEAQAAAQRASDAKVVKLTGGGQIMPDSVQQIVPSSGTPAPRVETPNKGTSSPSESKPTTTKPSAEKNAVENAGNQTPQGQGQQLPQSPGAQQGQQQGGAPQQSGAPAGGAAPSGARTTGVPVSTPTPVRAVENGGRGGGVRSTPSSPVQSQAQRAGLGNGGRTTQLGSGSGATGAGGIGSPTANKGGVAPTSSASGSGTSNTTSRGPMGSGVMGGAGHGAGQGGTTRPKADIKSRDPRLTGEDVAAEALGGIVRETDGAPTPPAVPGVSAPVPPTPPKR